MPLNPYQSPEERPGVPHRPWRLSVGLGTVAIVLFAIAFILAVGIPAFLTAENTKAMRRLEMAGATGMYAALSGGVICALVWAIRRNRPDK